MSLSARTAVASAILLLSAGAAQADITSYTSQAAYLAAVGNTGIDTFDDLDIEPYEGPLVRDAGDYSYELSTGPETADLWGASDDGSDFWVTPGWSGDGLTFTFNGATAGAGGFFFGSDLFGFSSPLEAITITATDSGGATLSYTIETPDVGSFVGFVSDVALTSLFVKGSEPGVFTTVNDLHVSVAAVPEPETYGMLLAGLGLLGYAARRKARNP
jgi:hypothetical protein